MTAAFYDFKKEFGNRKIVVDIKTEKDYKDPTADENNSCSFHRKRPNMTDTVETTVVAAAKPVLKTLADIRAFILTAIALQNEITVVSSEIVSVKGLPGKRIELVLEGAGVGNPTRRYFLRENSAFASAIEEAGIICNWPDKARGVATYMGCFGMNEAAVNYEAPKPEKPAKVLLSAEEKKERRAAGKAAAKAKREAEAAAAPAADETATVAETAEDVNAETTVLEGAEFLVTTSETPQEVNSEERELETA